MHTIKLLKIRLPKKYFTSRMIFFKQNFFVLEIKLSFKLLELEIAKNIFVDYKLQLKVVIKIKEAICNNRNI